MIVRQIRTLIRTGELPVGTRLPAERVLCDRMGVSRLTLREALRALEVNGLIEIRAGAHGGAFVTAPTAGSAAAGITDLLSISGLSAADVTEARIAFELGIVPLIAERATAQDLAELRALCDEAEAAREEGSYTVAMSFGFHLRAAAASHNPAVVLLLDSFREAILMSMRQAHHEGKQGVAEHRAFVDAIERGEPGVARKVMGDHLQRTADAVAPSAPASAPLWRGC
ncbi:FadR/GntR family transcriptional regulator [Streptomyces sp. TS71-3]|uniref:FadR/GntR family transcriptional regulator n=1 Tax=Streptomyces sp. TS71-3 TaxID=2733862 RepID=UPI001BB3D2DC|nr:FadR/GntR family transcriptional regulator [Streptomyces sp. TS71-3]